jgi:hypothetical protein
MSSSRSIAAARARRSGEQAPPVSGNRPITSINSHAAFAQQPVQQQYQQPFQNIQVGSSNVRVAKSQQMQMPPPPPQTQEPSNGLPFTKLTVSDAIGLITLRLGRVEQYLIDLESGEHTLNEQGTGNLPENSKIIDNSVFISMMNRLDSIEKRDPTSNQNENFIAVKQELTTLKDSLISVKEEFNKQTLITTQNKEQLFKLERDLVETKDILKTVSNHLELFVTETVNKFNDYEYAISVLEKNILEVDGLENDVIEEGLEENENENDNDNDTEKSNILSYDLKNIIKQELAQSN